MEFTLSAKQSAQLATLEKLVNDFGITLYVNAELPPKPYNWPVSLDVEHDESGGFVGVGLYFPNSNSHYWFTDIDALSDSSLSAVSIVAHNGVSDLDIMRTWGFYVQDEQLVFDTMLVGHILDSSVKSYGLKDMVYRDLGISYPTYDDIVGKRTTKQSVERITLDKQPPRLVQLYNCLDCYVTSREMNFQLGKLY